MEEDRKKIQLDMEVFDQIIDAGNADETTIVRSKALKLKVEIEAKLRNDLRQKAKFNGLLKESELIQEEYIGLPMNLIVRLSRWKAKALSAGGRNVPAQVVLGSLATYFLSIFKAPVRTRLSLKEEKMRKDFFWGSDYVEIIAWVKWGDVIKSIDRGGLGLESIDAANLALLIKWVWELHFEPTSSWSKVIKAIHDQNGGGEIQMGLA
ncbi:uncharacterized protein LOC112517739 [Cynara cardunculus var. scolymus]|uniref:uncharacterized protein LOC112517739 n=1 Tax=Cynara cardunculus var. scolymus TaxID=59895 RepID=UPI000D62A9F7|nr:uncharacterized protein LOC112517739 [Cynara cardunculus var. scolymus]